MNTSMAYDRHKTHGVIVHELAGVAFVTNLLRRHKYFGEEEVLHPHRIRLGQEKVLYSYRSRLLARKRYGTPIVAVSWPERGTVPLS